MKKLFFLMSIMGGAFSLLSAQVDKMKALQVDVVNHPHDRKRLYNLGVEAIKKQDWRQARDAFSCAKTVEDEQPLDALHGEQLFYNAGNVEMKLADYGAAEKSFDAVLRYNASNEKARQKRDLARRLKEEQEQQKKSDEKKESQKPQDDAKKDDQKGSPKQNDAASSSPEKERGKGGESSQDRDQQSSSAPDQQHDADKKQQEKQRGLADKKKEEQAAAERKKGDLGTKQQPSASACEEKNAEKQGWGGAEEKLTEQDQLILQRVDHVDRANAKEWMRLQTAHMGGDYEQHKW